MKLTVRQKVILLLHAGSMWFMCLWVVGVFYDNQASYEKIIYISMFLITWVVGLLIMEFKDDNKRISKR